MPLNPSKLNGSTESRAPELKRPVSPSAQASDEPPPPPARSISPVRSDGAMQTANGAAAQLHQLDNYVEDFHAAVGKRVDDAAFSIAAALATIPAQLANRTQYYLGKMNSGEAWAQFDRALGEAARTPGEQLLFGSDVFAAPENLFEGGE